MDNAGYVALTRQEGLLRALQIGANNVANMGTAGFRREGTVFAEMLVALRDPPGTLAMTAARVRTTDMRQGPLETTGGPLDLALDGPGFFRVETAAGERLTRAGAFARSAEGLLVTLAGDPVLDENGAPILLPPEAGRITVGPDGALEADGAALGRIGVVEAANPAELTREAGLLFVPAGELRPAEGTRIVQGALEGSNVSPVAELARMVEIQRSYEFAQGLVDREDERIRNVIRTLGQRA